MSPADAAQRTGARVAGKYVLGRVLGRGGMGTVYEAEHAFTGRAVAVKLLHLEHATSAPTVERFLREARAASAIRHPGIVDVLDAGQEPDGTLYLVLELLAGSDLAAAIAQHRVDALGVVRVARQLLDALGAAHSHGVVHRDLKPENVFLCDDGRVKLLDFGIAKREPRDGELALTATGAVLGTPYYMSPEQARGAEVDARSDLWSLGAVLFHALAGRPPFQGHSYNALLAAILTQSAPPLASVRPDVPAVLASVVDRALVRDVAARWQSAAEMSAALDEVLAQATTQVMLRSVALAATLPSDAPSGVRTAGTSIPIDVGTPMPLYGAPPMAAVPAYGAPPAIPSAPPAAIAPAPKKTSPWLVVGLGAIVLVGVLLLLSILGSALLIDRWLEAPGAPAQPTHAAPHPHP